MGHTLDHFRLNSAVSVILAVEVLRFVAHTMTSVADDRDLNLGVVWHLLLFTMLVGGHCNLESS